MDGLEDFLRTHNGGKLLDIACGGGRFTRRLVAGLRSYTSVTGLDIKAGLEAEFLDSVDGHDVAFVTSAISDYLETDNRFDTISISNALHHLEGVGDILRGLQRIMNSDGVAIVNEMYSDDLTPAQQPQHGLHGMMAKLHRTMGEYHREPFARSEIHDFISDAGLIVQHTSDVSNDDAPVTKGADGTGMTQRVREAIAKAYPDGAPPGLQGEFEQLKVRASEIGVAPPPQLTLVCRLQ